MCSDQEAVDLVRNVQDPVVASKQLVDHALARFSTDNLSCMIVRLNKAALLDTVNNHLSSAIGVEGDPIGGPGRLSEAEKIVADARRKAEEDGVPSVGVSGSNSGKGHEPKKHEEESSKTLPMEKVVEEETVPAVDDPENGPAEAATSSVPTIGASKPTTSEETVISK